MKNKQPNALREIGDSIEGERIMFQCRECHVSAKPTRGSSSHRARHGKLRDAICVVTKKFRHIPDGGEKS